MKKILAISLLVVSVIGITVSGCSKIMSAESVQMLDSTLKTLNENGVVWSGTLEGPTEGGFELYQGGRAKTGGWLSLRVQSPVGNPFVGDTE
jgi:hypothetical protein